MSIPKGSKKINIVVLIAIFVVLGIMFMTGAFRFGSISGQKQPIKVIPPTLDFTSKNEQKTAQISQVIASKTGSKYHLPTCPGAKAITEGNRVVFNTIEEAEKAGYTPAANCPGLQK